MKREREEEEEEEEERKRQREGGRREGRRNVCLQYSNTEKRHQSSDCQVRSYVKTRARRRQCVCVCVGPPDKARQTNHRHIRVVAVIEG